MQENTNIAVTPELTPLSQEIIRNQSTIIIGTLGHVSHGKSTLVETLSGIKPIKFDDEKKRNITIKLGYAGFKIFKCQYCPKPDCFQSAKSNAKELICKHCNSKMDLIRHFAFADCPGHDMLISTLLNGAAVMDAALLLIAADQKCPQPQTEEHLVAASIMDIKNITVVQSKLDLVSPEKAKENYKQIKDFVTETPAESSTVIPLCCTPALKANVDVLLQHLVEKVPIPKRDFTSSSFMTIVRSFDVNQPGTTIDKLKGGVAGGTLKKGILKIGDRVEIRPGLLLQDSKGNYKCKPIITRVVSMFADSNHLKVAVPGGLIGVGTTVDSTLTKGDRLVGHVLGAVGTLPDCYIRLEIKYRLMRRVVGLADATQKVSYLKDNEKLMLNVGSMTTSAMVSNATKKTATLTLKKPVCIEKGESISLSRQVSQSWRIIGNAQIISGTPITVETM